MITRKTPIFFPIGMVCIAAGFCSFCIGSMVPRDSEPAPPQLTSQNFVSCSGVSEMIVSRKEFVSPTLQTECWSPAIRTGDGKGGMRTEARNGESYVGYCGNGNQFSVDGRRYWHNTRECPFPVYFKTMGKPFVLFITQE